VPSLNVDQPIRNSLLS